MQIPRNLTNIEILIEHGAQDMRTLEELDHKRRDQVETRSEATVSKLDLQAPKRAQKEYSKGMRLFHQKDFKDSIESLKKAVEIYPKYVAAHNALGCAYFNLGQNDQARDEFAQATQLDDHLSNSYLNLGRAELALGHVPQAEAAMGKAASIAPLDLNLQMALTYVQFLNHDYSDAIKTAEKVHGHKHEGVAMVHYFAAAAWQEQNKLEETQRELQTLLSEDPNSPVADQAHRILEQIKIKQEQASTSTAPITISVDTSKQEAPMAQKALQDFREKQQIADAEREGENCTTCAVPDPPRQPVISAVAPVGHDPHNPEYSAWTLRSTVDEVALFFTVTDHGRSVSDLTQAELTVRDDKKPPANVREFRSESALPLHLGLIIDTSVSITDRFSFEQKSAADFVEHVLTNKNDLGFVAGFSNSVVLAQDFTANPKLISHGINQLVPVGGTAIWDAVSYAADKLAEIKDTQPVARMLVVISDGDDNSSSATLKQAIERAERDEVIVYTVSTREAEVENNDSLAGNHALTVLAELTGGQAFFPGSTSHLNRTLDEQQVIRSRYLISYKPAEFHRDGSYRAISVIAQRPGHKLKVNARKGYYTTINSSEAGNF